MQRITPPSFIFTLSFALPMICWTTSLLANAAPSWQSGQMMAEPVGIVDVEITNEVLSIDLRPVAHQQPAKVNAIYQLNNPGDEKKLELLFASGASRITGFLVTIDGQAIPSEPIPVAYDNGRRVPELPVSWSPPKTTPAPKGTVERPIPYHPVGVQCVRFTITIPKGTHELEVVYRAETTSYRSSFPTVLHQFAYVLAPARAWSKFGGLDVSIDFPETWEITATSGLSREGNQLVGRFDSIPADAFAMTMHAPVSQYYYTVRTTSRIAIPVVFLFGAIACIVVGRRAREMAWLYGGLAALGWTVLLFVTGGFAIFGPDLLLATGQESVHGYGRPLAVIGIALLGVVVLPVGFTLATIANAIK